MNGIGTPNSTIVLNKKGIIISGEGEVTFDAKGGNVHFEVTEEDVLIEKITETSISPTGEEQWTGNNGILKNCNFINNAADRSGGAVWFDSNAVNGNLIASTFINNTAKRGNGGAVIWSAVNGTIRGSTFIKNKAIHGGAIYWIVANCNLDSSNFINNTAVNYGGGVRWSGNNNGILTESNFTGNTAANGAGVYWVGRQ